MAAQEQSLKTRSMVARVHHTRQEPRWRLCKDALETVWHIAAECNMQAVKVYFECHNQLTSILHRDICAEYGLEVPESK